MTGNSSITQNVYSELRADLLACRLAPGQKLEIDELCHRLSAGSSAVREALSRLASEGFVVSEPQRGFRVTPLDLDELADLTNTRCQIEELCIRDSIAHGAVEWETSLIAALHRLSRTPVQADGDNKRYSEAFAAAHNIFHEAVVGACASRWLLQVRQMLSTQQERYRWLSRPLAKTERDLDKEHSAIARAALDRDADAAVALMTEHLQKTASIVLEAAAASAPARAIPGRPRSLASNPRPASRAPRLRAGAPDAAGVPQGGRPAGNG